MATVLHNTLTSADLHFALIEEIVGTPIGSKAPPAVGYPVIAEIGGEKFLFVSTGLTILDWVLVKTAADASDVDYDNSTSGLAAVKVQAAIDELAATNRITFSHSGTAAAEVLGTILQANARGALWDVVVESGTDFYKARVTAIHDKNVNVDFDISNVLRLGNSIAGLLLTVVADGTNMELEVTSNPANTEINVVQLGI